MHCILWKNGDSVSWITGSMHYDREVLFEVLKCCDCAQEMNEVVKERGVKI
jgi:hypothetical protein